MRAGTAQQKVLEEMVGPNQGSCLICMTWKKTPLVNMIPDPLRVMEPDSFSVATAIVTACFVTFVAFIELPTGLFLSTAVCLLLSCGVMYAIVHWGFQDDESEGEEYEELEREPMLAQELRTLTDL